MRLVCLLTAVLLGGLRAPAQPQLLNCIQAIANDAIITMQDVELASMQAVVSAERLYGRNSPQFLQKWREARQDAVEQLIERQLILADFKTGGRVLPESFIDEQIRHIIRERYGNRVTLTKSLQAENVTFEAFRQRTRDDLILRIMDSHNVREAILISPAKIERYYQTNLTRYKLADQVKLRVLILETAGLGTPDEVRALAGEILAKIEGGESLAEMAKAYSTGSSRKEGGDWGWWEDSKLSKGIADVVTRLQTGGRSDVFSLAREPDDSYWVYHYDRGGKLTTGRKYTGKEVFLEEKRFDQTTHAGLPAQPFEFRIMQVDERKVAHTRPLGEVRDEIERELIAQERIRLRKIWIDRLRAKSFVRYY